MSTVREIKEAISVLPQSEFAELRDWLIEKDRNRWDDQLSGDSESEKLDFLLDEANEEDLKELQMHKATNRFWTNYESLDPETKRIADRSFGYPEIESISPVTQV